MSDRCGLVGDLEFHFRGICDCNSLEIEKKKTWVVSVKFIRFAGSCVCKPNYWTPIVILLWR